MELFANLPKELKTVILSFDGSIRYRRGEYINQICRDDDRYRRLANIPPRTVHIDADIPSFVSMKITQYKWFMYHVITEENSVVYVLQTLFYMNSRSGVSFLNNEITTKYNHHQI
jgi:hypothetical protein